MLHIMRRRLLASTLGFALAASPVAGLPLAAAPTRASVFYNAREHPLPEPVVSLLIKSRYELRSDGTLWAPGGANQVPAQGQTSESMGAPASAAVLYAVAKGVVKFLEKRKTRFDGNIRRVKVVNVRATASAA